MDLKHVNEEIASLSIVISDACTNRRYSALLKRRSWLTQPVASMEIPNSLFILWTEKLAMQCQQCNSVFKHSALANLSIQEGCGIRLSEAVTVETRLCKERSRITKRYSKLRKGSRIKLYNATTHVILFQNEIIEMGSIPTDAAAIQSDPVTTIQFHGKETMNMYNYIAIVSLLANSYGRLRYIAIYLPMLLI